jgi:uncharacterized membrane protein
MIRSALIIGAIAFLYMLFANVAQMLCVPFLAIVLGILAGGLAGFFDKPQRVNKAVVNGALAGVIAGIGAVLGNLAGLAMRIFVIFGQDTFADMITNATGVQYTSTDTMLGIFSLFCCCAVSDIVLMAATGALGGFLWFKFRSGKNPAAAPPQVLH